MSVMSKKTKAPFQIRQGDVFLTRVDDVPTDATASEERNERGLILQHGEVTGHAHRVPHRAASMYRSETDARFMRVTAPVPLLHEEHQTRCSLCTASFSIATHYESGGDVVEAKRYMCDDHSTPLARKLEHPGETVVPPGVYRVSIHAEYVPGELPRQVVD